MKDSYEEHKLNKNNPTSWFMGQPIISDQITKEGLKVVWDHLQATLEKNIPGAIVEFGCYIGTTSLFIRRLLDQANQSSLREFHIYDSFEGLPEKSTEDKNAAGVDFEAGKLYTSKKELVHQFKSAGLVLPTIHKGWFNQLRPLDTPDPIAFAFLDGDFYDSILSSLKLVMPRMSKGGTILIDDYKRETLPGVERAVSSFFQTKNKHILVEKNIATIVI